MISCNRENLTHLEKILGYKFKNAETACTAIRHPGLKKHDKNFARKFEKLEFLGDRVLGLSLTTLLYENCGEDSEGDLAVRIATLAGTDFLIELAKKTGIIKCFSIPKDFFVSINKTSSSIADMMEAVFAAIYLDSNFDTTKNVIKKLWSDDLDKVVYKEKDAKSQLQELFQAQGKSLPTYRLIKMTGEAHDPIFEVEVTADAFSAIGYGNTKKSAEHDAAGRLIAQLNNLKNEKEST